MLFIRIYRPFVLNLLFVSLLLSSCHRRLSVQNNKYQQYGVDAQIPVDSNVIRYYLPYKNQLSAEMSRVIGHTDQQLTKPSEPETLLGDYFSDALLIEGRKKDPSIQFTLSTKGGLRTTFPKGDITVDKVFELMPFENELVVLKLTGANVQKVIDFIARSNGQPVAGIRMKIRNKVAYDVTIDGKPFDLNQTYVLLTYDYLADGGDNMEFLSNPLERRDINKRVREAILDNIADLTREGKPINAQLDGRIIVTSE